MAKKHVLSALVVLMMVLSLMFSSTLLFDKSLFVGAGAVDWTHQTNLTTTNKVLSIDFASNNTWLAGCGDDNYVHIYNVSDWTETHNITFSGTGDILDVKFSNDSNYIAYAGEASDIVYVNYTGSWTNVTWLTEPNNNVKEIAWSGDNKWIAVGGMDDNLYIYNVTDSFSLEKTLSANDDVMTVAFSPNSTYVAWGDKDGNVHINETGGSWTNVTWLTEAHVQVNQIDWSQDGKWIAYCGHGSSTYDNRTYIHNISDSWSNETVINYGTDLVKRVAFSFNNTYLAFSTGDGKAVIHNVSDWSLARTLTTTDSGVSAVGIDFSDDNNWFAFSDANTTVGHIYVWNMSEGVADTASSYSISGLDGNSRITFSGNNNSVIWSNQSYGGGGGHLVILSDVNSSDSVSEIHINISDNIDAQINADNVSIELNLVNGSNWTGNTHQVTTDGENITLNSSVWVSSNWCHGANPFPITNELITIYVRFELTLGSVTGGTYTMDDCEVAWKITYTP